MLPGISADPQPRTAQLNRQPFELQKQLDDLSELLRGLGGLVELVGACVVLLLEPFKMHQNGKQRNKVNIFDLTRLLQ